MGSKLLGSDYRLWIESSTAGTFNQIKGQTKMKVSRSRAEIDSSSKDDEGWDTSLNGNKKLTIDLELKPSLPDANGFSRMESAFASGDPTRFQIRKGGADGGETDVVFDCVMIVGSFDDQKDNGDVVQVTSQLRVNQAPTVDTLA